MGFGEKWKPNRRIFDVEISTKMRNCQCVLLTDELFFAHTLLD